MLVSTKIAGIMSLAMLVNGLPNPQLGGVPNPANTIAPATTTILGIPIKQCTLMGVVVRCIGTGGTQAAPANPVVVPVTNNALPTPAMAAPMQAANALPQVPQVAGSIVNGNNSLQASPGIATGVPVAAISNLAPAVASQLSGAQTLTLAVPTSIPLLGQITSQIPVAVPSPANLLSNGLLPTPNLGWPTGVPNVPAVESVLPVGIPTGLPAIPAIILQSNPLGSLPAKPTGLLSNLPSPAALANFIPTALPRTLLGGTQVIAGLLPTTAFLPLPSLGANGLPANPLAGFIPTAPASLLPGGASAIAGFLPTSILGSGIPPLPTGIPIGPLPGIIPAPPVTGLPPTSILGNSAATPVTVAIPVGTGGQHLTLTPTITASDSSPTQAIALPLTITVSELGPTQVITVTVTAPSAGSSVVQTVIPAVPLPTGTGEMPSIASNPVLTAHHPTTFQTIVRPTPYHTGAPLTYVITSTVAYKASITHYAEAAPTAEEVKTDNEAVALTAAEEAGAGIISRSITVTTSSPQAHLQARFAKLKMIEPVNLGDPGSDACDELRQYRRFLLRTHVMQGNKAIHGLYVASPETLHAPPRFTKFYREAASLVHSYETNSLSVVWGRKKECRVAGSVILPTAGSSPVGHVAFTPDIASGIMVPKHNNYFANAQGWTNGQYVCDHGDDVYELQWLQSGWKTSGNSFNGFRVDRQKCAIVELRDI